MESDSSGFTANKLRRTFTRGSISKYPTSTFNVQSGILFFLVLLTATADIGHPSYVGYRLYYVYSKRPFQPRSQTAILNLKSSPHPKYRSCSTKPEALRMV